MSEVCAQPPIGLEKPCLIGWHLTLAERVVSIYLQVRVRLV
ncbi:UNVERIFIED_CONTAM: hypothetical protein GTU68_058651 [Idotea baltica]|nr:hypothetical protein [Idotea baltica]